MGCWCHPDITAVFTFADDGSPFITMWRAEGQNHLALLRETPGSGECDWPITAIISANPRVPQTAAPASPPPVSSFPFPPIREKNYLFVSPYYYYYSILLPQLLLCFFFASLLPHWENTSCLLNYRSQVACQQQMLFNTPLKIHPPVLTMNIIKAASCGPPE